MYQNKVTLIGFLGSNAKPVPIARTSVSPPSRWQPNPPIRRDGKYISHTEWHRCVVFGKLSEFAQTRLPRVRISRWKANCAPGVRQQENGLEAEGLGDSGRLDPETGPR